MHGDISKHADNLGHIVTEPGYLPALKMGGPHEKHRRVGRVGHAVPRAAIGEARQRRPNEGGSVKTWKQFNQFKLSYEGKKRKTVREL